jgi:hypothetical protein
MEWARNLMTSVSFILLSYWKQCFVQKGGVSFRTRGLNFPQLDQKLSLLVQGFLNSVPRHVGMGPAGQPLE